MLTWFAPYASLHLYIRPLPLFLCTPVLWWGSDSLSLRQNKERGSIAALRPLKNPQFHSQFQLKRHRRPRPALHLQLPLILPDRRQKGKRIMISGILGNMSCILKQKNGNMCSESKWDSKLGVEETTLSIKKWTSLTCRHLPVLTTRSDGVSLGRRPCCRAGG